MKPKMVVSRGLRHGFNGIMFPAKMREKGTKVALANGSLMSKSVEFSISLIESKCNCVCLNVHIFLLVLDGLFIALI